MIRNKSIFTITDRYVYNSEHGLQIEIPKNCRGIRLKYCKLINATFKRRGGNKDPLKQEEFPYNGLVIVRVKMLARGSIIYGEFLYDIEHNEIIHSDTKIYPHSGSIGRASLPTPEVEFLSPTSIADGLYKGSSLITCSSWALVLELFN